MHIIRVLIGLIALLPAWVIAAGDAEAGKALAAPCAACHGQNGIATVPGSPNLAGQNPRYLESQLQMIQSGVRAAALMTGQLTNMSATDLKSLAVYFAAMPASVGQATGDQIAQGEQIYRGGISHKAVPACSACHSPSGSGNSPAGYPHIGGQQSDYVVAQLTAYREGIRATDEAYGQTMRQASHGLTDGEIRAVASYIQGLH
jgi:cytochrome c553